MHTLPSHSLAVTSLWTSQSFILPTKNLDLGARDSRRLLLLRYYAQEGAVVAIRISRFLSTTGGHQKAKNLLLSNDYKRLIGVVNHRKQFGGLRTPELVPNLV